MPRGPAMPQMAQPMTGTISTSAAQATLTDPLLLLLETL